MTAERFTGEAVLETRATPAVIHIHKLDRLENAVSPGQGWGEGATRTRYAPHPGPLPTAASSPKIVSPVGRGSRVTGTDVGDRTHDYFVVRTLFSRSLTTVPPFDSTKVSTTFTNF